jgi:hypothetical protein
MILAIAAAMAVAAVPAASAPNPHKAAELDAAPAVELVAQGCGPGWHRVPPWRDRYGNWHPGGRCVPN